MSAPTVGIFVAPAWFCGGISPNPIGHLGLGHLHPARGLNLTAKAWHVFKRDLQQKVVSSSDCPSSKPEWMNLFL